MPVSAYFGDILVEIAFNAGFNTPAASRVWTDVSDWVELDRDITITVGRGDERSNADANTLTLTLDNSDGRFTAARAASPYYPNVKLDRPIRVTTTPVDGPPLVEFLGFINEWPTEWDGVDAQSYVTISASSRLARLGLVATLKSVVEQAIMADSPTAYYTLGEPVGAKQASDTSGQRGAPLVVVGDAALPMVFGSAAGPGTDGLTAAQFVGGQYLDVGSALTGGVGITLECFFLVGPSVSAQSFLTVQMSGSSALSIGVDGFGFIRGKTRSTTVSGPPYSHDTTHHLAIVWTSGILTFYLDGVASGSTLVGGGPAANPGAAVTVGQDNHSTLSHVAVTPAALTADQIATHAAAGLTGYEGETTAERLIRYAGYAGVDSAQIDAEAGQVTVEHVDTTGKQVVELMRIMEATEGGVLFDNPDGTTAFHNRAHRLTAPAAITLNMARHMVEVGYVPKLDRSTIANDVTSADVTGQFTAHVFDTASKTDNGVATMSIETAAQDNDEPLFLASWALHKYMQPQPRVPTLSVDCLAQVGKTPTCATVLATSVSDKVTVSNRPSQDSSSSASFFVEGYTRVYGPELCMTTFNVSPSSPEDQTLVIGDPLRGVIGTNPVAL